MADLEPKDDPNEPKAIQAKWLREISRAEKYFEQWFQRSEKIVKLYRKQNDTEKSKRRFAMLWANTEVLKPTVYAKPPEPAVSRRFKDRDPAGRTASDILERAASYEFERGDIDETLKAARDDLLLPGRGACWVRFLENEQVIADYIHWRDFLHKPARRWKEVTWVAKRSYFDKAEIQKRFTGLSKEQLAGMTPDNTPKSSGLTDEEKKAIGGKYSVWEIWDKTTNKVIFISPCCTEPLEIVEPFLSLSTFWPCPKPLYATLTTDSLIPIPDYKYYQDQAEEIDDLTRRIASLTDSLKMVIFYPKGGEDTGAAIEKALQPSSENIAIGVESWAAFSEKGGSNAIVTLPIKEVAEVIKSCVELRRQMIEDVYQITGISDIMRGSTDPNETLGAQQLKAQNGSIRVRDRQAEVQRFARDVTRIMCEIIAEKYQPKTLIEMTNMNTQENNNPEKMKELEQAFKILKDDRLRGFRIEIETDSTIQPDEDAEKNRRVEFITAMGGFFKEAMPVAQMEPKLIPMIGEMLRFTVRGFRAGRQLEDVIDKTVDEMVQAAQQAAQQPPPPTPDQVKAQAIQQKAQTDAQAKQQDSQLKAQETQANLQGKALEGQIKQQIAGQQMQMKGAEHAQTMQFKAAESAQNLHAQQQGATMDLHNQQAKNQQQLQLAKQNAAIKAKQQAQRPAAR